MSQFVIGNLSVQSYANNFSLWHYRASDITEIHATFFVPAADMFSQGDMILVSAPNGGSHLFVLGTAPLDVRQMIGTGVLT
jgi:hypothetical protein